MQSIIDSSREWTMDPNLLLDELADHVPRVDAREPPRLLVEAAPDPRECLVEAPHQHPLRRPGHIEHEDVDTEMLQQTLQHVDGDRSSVTACKAFAEIADRSLPSFDYDGAICHVRLMVVAVSWHATTCWCRVCVF